MHAIAEAKRMYAERGLNFEERLGWYLTHGLVVSREDRFLMAKAVNSKHGDKADDTWDEPNPDCWYVECAVGQGCLEWFLMQAPIRLQKLAWRRLKDGANKLKYYPTSAFERFAS